MISNFSIGTLSVAAAALTPDEMLAGFDCNCVRRVQRELEIKKM